MPDVGTIGTAEVDIRAKLDSFERDLTAAQSKLRSFDQSADASAMHVRKLDSDSVGAGKAIAALGTAFAGAKGVLDAFGQASEKADAAVKGFVTGTEQSAQASHAATAANDNHAKGLKGTAESAAHAALEVLKISGYIRLGVAVAQAGIPAFKSLSESFVKIAGSTLGMIPGFTRFGQAATDAKSKLDPLLKVAGGAEIIKLASHFNVATAAAYTMSPAFRQVANEEVLHGIKALGPAVGSVGTAALAAGRTAAPVFGGMLATFTRLALPVTAAVASFKALFDLFKQGQEYVENVDKLLTQAASFGVSGEFLKGMTESAKKFHLETDAAAKSLEAFSKFSEPKLGGSGLDQMIKELKEAGNLANNLGLQTLRSATTVEERYRAATAVITEMISKGERLAALKIAESFLSPQALTRLKTYGDFLDGWQTKADKISKSKIIDEANVATALELKSRLDDAYDIIKTQMVDVALPSFTALSLQIYGVWVKLVETFASAVDYASDLASTIGDKLVAAWDAVSKPVIYARDTINGMITIANTLAQAFENKVAAKVKDIRNYINSWIEPLNKIFAAIDKFVGTKLTIDFGQMAPETTGGLKQTIAAIHDIGVEATKTDKASENMTAAMRKLAIGMQDPNKQLMQARQAMDVEMAVLKDTSKTLDENQKAWEHLTTSIARHIAVQQAEAQAMDKGVGAIAALRVQTELEAVAASRHITITAARRAEIEKLAKQASDAAIALAKMKIQTEVQFQAKTMFLPEEEVTIARQLKDIYPDVARALKSVEAEQLRFLTYLKQTKDETIKFGTQFATSFVDSILAGQKAAKALQAATSQLFKGIVDQLVQVIAKRALEQLLATFAVNMTTSIAGTSAPLLAAATTAATELTAAGTLVNGALISGATEAAGILTTAGAATGAAMAGGGAAAGGAAAAGGIGSVIASFAERFGAIFGFQHGGIVPPGQPKSAQFAIVHSDEEVLTPQDPRHSYNVGQQPQQAPGPINLAVHFTANGRMTQGEIADHAMTIAKHVSRVFDNHPSTRPTY
jgi:hypothetical protein